MTSSINIVLGASLFAILACVVFDVSRYLKGRFSLTGVLKPVRHPCARHWFSRFDSLDSKALDSPGVKSSPLHFAFTGREFRNASVETQDRIDQFLAASGWPMSESFRSRWTDMGHLIRYNIEHLICERYCEYMCSRYSLIFNNERDLALLAPSCEGNTPEEKRQAAKATILAAIDYLQMMLESAKQEVSPFLKILGDAYRNGHPEAIRRAKMIIEERGCGVEELERRMVVYLPTYIRPFTDMKTRQQ